MNNETINDQIDVFYPKFIPNSIWDILSKTIIFKVREEFQWTCNLATNTV